MTDNEDADFEAFDFEKLIARLNEHQPPTSGVSAWERMVAAIVSKSKAELREMIASQPDEYMELLVDELIKTEEIMRIRHGFVTMALARICAVAPDPEAKAA